MKKALLLLLIGIFSLSLSAPALANNDSSSNEHRASTSTMVVVKYKRHPVELKGTLVSVASTTAPTSLVLKIDKISPKKGKKWTGFYPEVSKELTVAITAKTKIVRMYWGQSSLEELTVGDNLQVSAWTNEDGTLTATWVKDNSLNYTLKVKKGTIESIDIVNKTFVLKDNKISITVKTSDKTKLYSVDEAIKLLKKIKFTAFDQSVELHLNVDETGLRGEVELPNSTGKTVRIAVVDDKVLENIEKGKIDFDVLVTHPSFMPKLAKFAKVLGPKGLMPNPKAGTISPTPDVVVKKFQKGTIRWKTEAKAPLIHQMIGKLSHDDKALVENATKFVSSVGAKHIQNAFIKSTMSPSLKIEIIKE